MEAISVSMLMGLAMAMASLLIIRVAGQDSPVDHFSGGHYSQQMRKMKALKTSLLRRDSVSLPPSSAAAPSPSGSPSQVTFCKNGFCNNCCSPVMIRPWCGDGDVGRISSTSVSRDIVRCGSNGSGR